jgi:hypothetical protein
LAFLSCLEIILLDFFDLSNNNIGEGGIPVFGKLKMAVLALLNPTKGGPTNRKQDPRAKKKAVECRCGVCPACLDNARWERIFQQKFADPAYRKRDERSKKKAVNCHCGKCPACLDNTRWERIFQQKFADPAYYDPKSRPPDL